METYPICCFVNDKCSEGNDKSQVYGRCKDKSVSSPNWFLPQRKDESPVDRMGIGGGVWCDQWSAAFFGTVLSIRLILPKAM